jgi:hypothetical protein
MEKPVGLGKWVLIEIPINTALEIPVRTHLPTPTKYVREKPIFVKGSF